MIDQLLLQTDRVRRNDDSLFLFSVSCVSLISLRRKNGGNQIGEAFADAGAGFCDQMLLIGQRVFNGFCHGQLLRPRFVAGQSASNNTSGTEHVGNRMDVLVHEVSRGGQHKN